jgi:hypothetical protein
MPNSEWRPVIVMASANLMTLALTVANTVMAIGWQPTLDVLRHAKVSKMPTSQTDCPLSHEKTNLKTNFLLETQQTPAI